MIFYQIFFFSLLNHHPGHHDHGAGHHDHGHHDHSSSGPPPAPSFAPPAPLGYAPTGGTGPGSDSYSSPGSVDSYDAPVAPNAYDEPFTNFVQVNLSSISMFKITFWGAIQSSPKKCPEKPFKKYS